MTDCEAQTRIDFVGVHLPEVAGVIFDNVPMRSNQQAILLSLYDLAQVNEKRKWQIQAVMQQRDQLEKLCRDSGVPEEAIQKAKDFLQ